HLDVLASHVEAELFGHLDVVAKGFVGRSGVDAIWPEALVEWAELEVRLIVQHEPREAFLIFAKGNFAHAEITLDAVEGLAPKLEFHGEAVQVRIFGSPEPGVFYRHGDSAARGDGCFINLAPAIIDTHLDRILAQHRRRLRMY